MKIPVYILAGGKNSRFGSDKARALLRGEPLLIHVARVIQPYTSRLTVVAEKPDKYRDLDLRTIADRVPGIGPLGGLHRAIQDLEDSEWMLLTSCDLLGVRAAWINSLLSYRDWNGGVIAFRGERWEPLLALYHGRLKRLIESAVKSAKPALWRFIEQAKPLSVPLPEDWHDAAQINTVEALETYSKSIRILDNT